MRELIIKIRLKVLNKELKRITERIKKYKEEYDKILKNNDFKKIVE